MWDQIAGWVVLAGVVGGVWWGRRLTRAKTARIKSEAYAQGMRDQTVAQQVNVYGDDRRTVAFDQRVALGATADHGPAYDRSDVERAAFDAAWMDMYRARLRELGGGRELGTRWGGPALADGDAARGTSGAEGASVNGQSLGPAWYEGPEG